jgi:hypothetical protein
MGCDPHGVCVQIFFTRFKAGPVRRSCRASPTDSSSGKRLTPERGAGGDQARVEGVGLTDARRQQVVA